MAKNLVSGLILVPLAQIWASKIFLWILPVLDVRHYCQLSLYAISRKTNKPNLWKWQKIILGMKTVGPDVGPDFGSDFGAFGLNSGRQFLSFSFAKIWFCQSLNQPSPDTMSEKANDVILRKLSDKGTERRMRVIS